MRRVEHAPGSSNKKPYCRGPRSTRRTRSHQLALDPGYGDDEARVCVLRLGDPFEGEVLALREERRLSHSDHASTCDPALLAASSRQPKDVVEAEI